ncbi:hypothetical protein [Rhodococcus jostii]|uniref:hypothetical protein n=1 Tax=Rhodococcus jostii TaxID=132919 RepID=UPI003629BFFE
MDISKNKKWLRKAAYAPLAVAVLAGAVCAGTGIGTAAPTTAPEAVTASTSTKDTPPASADPAMNWWTLFNNTGQPIYGTWSEQSGSDVSELNLVPNMPLRSSGLESRPRNDSPLWNSYWMGHICYRGAWWNFPREARSLGRDAFFRLTPADGDWNSLNVTWNSTGVEDPVVTPMIRNPHEAPCQ